MEEMTQPCVGCVEGLSKGLPLWFTNSNIRMLSMTLENFGQPEPYGSSHLPQRPEYRMHNLAHVAVQINFSYVQRSEKLHFWALYLFSILLNGLRHAGLCAHVDFVMAVNHGRVEVPQRFQFGPKVKFRSPFP